MKPHYIIDGYNFIHHIPKFKNAMQEGLEYSRNILISFIRAYQSSRNTHITLVFDGNDVGLIEQPPGSTSRLKIIYSHSPEKADPLIKRLIKKIENKKSLTLVSNDRELIDYCKSLGGKVLSPEAFYHQASKHRFQDQMEKKYNREISPDELDEWMKLFNEND